MKTRVADPALRREVEAAVRRRVRGDEAEDVVQATFADVLAARSVPDEPDEFRRFVFGVARNKVFDHFRRQKRLAEGGDDVEQAAPEPPLSARDILRWAEGALPDSEAQTLEWMLREGDGEKLEHIARDARLPATRVRKRVSRLRKFFRERWMAELTLAGLLVLLCGLGVLYFYGKGKRPEDVVEREPVRPVPTQRPEPTPAPAPSALPPSAPAGSAPLAPSAVPSLPTPAKPAPLPPRRAPTKVAPTAEDGRSFPAPILTAKPDVPPLLDPEVEPLEGKLELDAPDAKSSPRPSKATKPAPRPSKKGASDLFEK